jgi:tetratricopeptide (TPR) repeat protein
MKTNHLTFLAIAAAFLCSFDAQAQTDLNLPEASQLAVVKQRIGVTDITITYHRPLVKGRKIWGGLVPMDKVWRAGANENTTIEVSDPVLVEGKALPKGTYGLHMIPGASSWTVIFSKMAVAWGSYTYDKAEDALRVDVKPHSLSENEEALEYEFENPTEDSVTVTMKWEKMAVPFRISVTDADTIFPSIRNQLRGRAQYSWAPLNDAASFALTKKTNLDEGLKWADLSIQNEERFENLATKADILKAMNKADEAKKTWAHAMEKATPQQVYSRGRQLQSEKRDAEAMEIFQNVAKKWPDNVFGHLAQARIKSAAGDFEGATAEVKAGLAVAISDQQKTALQQLLDRLAAKQDINK